MKVLKIGLFVSILLALIYTLVFCIYPTPSMNRPYELTIRNEEEIEIYSQIRGEFSSYISLDNISSEMKKTIVISEDKNFYKHNGLDYLRIVKATIDNITSLDIQEGASTITQQLARTIYLNTSKNITRKLKEAFLAKKIESTYSKDKILELYLNSIYFGHNLYGIFSASHYYFGKDPSLLDYAESASLCAIIPSPANYSPKTNLQKNKEKKQSILYSLYQNKIISIEEYYKELEKKLNYTYYEPSFDNNLLFYQDAVKKEGKKYFLSSNYQNGLIFDTYLNFSIQSTISNIVKSKNLNSEEISVIVMKPNSGKVIALLGGKDYTVSSFNRAIDSSRQIGSTIKPLLYYLGLENNMTPLTKFKSEPITLNIDGVGEYSPKNAGEKYAYKDITMIEALGLSDNIYATKTCLLLGSNSLSNAIKKFGVKVDNINPTLALGTAEMSLLDLVSIYNTFASNGIYYEPSFYSQISLRNGKTIHQNKKKGIRLFNKDLSLIINYMLRSTFDKSLVSYTSPSLINYQTEKRFAAKTGSTSSSNYVIGYNPLYTIGIYVGMDNNEPLKNTKLCKELFQEIANQVTKKDEDIFFTPSSNLIPFNFYNKNLDRNSFTYYHL